jgi:hypothetical protein
VFIELCFVLKLNTCPCLFVLCSPFFVSRGIHSVILMHSLERFLH